MVDPLLERLRAIFFDELTDLVAVLEEQARVLGEEGLPQEEQRRAALELRRAAHSLKGAARAVDHREVERVCHQLEAQLAPALAPDVDLHVGALRAAALSAVDELRAWAEAHPPSSAPAGPAALQGRAPPASEVETLRVPVSRVSEISTLVEELMAEAARGEREAGGLLVIDEAVATLRRHLSVVVGRAPTRPVLESQSALQALSGWSLEQRRRQRSTWSSLLHKSDRLASATRALRATRLSVLRAALERTVLETAEDLGKQAALRFEGGDAEVDRRVVERLREPLVHLLRNAVDHGLEPAEERRASGKPAVGTVRVEARAAGTEVVIAVSDDGRGIDREALRRASVGSGLEGASDEELLTLLFDPGFTTKGAATTTSGRGIGLDVVRHRVAQMQGRVVVDGEPGKGTRFTVVVPADLSVTRGQRVEVRGRSFLLVETAVERARRVRPEEERLVEGRRYVQEGDGLLPLADLGSALGFGPGPERSGPRPALVLAAGGRRIAYLVDVLGGGTDIVIKPLGARVRRAAFVSGAALLREGEVACVLDAFALAQHGRAERGEGAAAPRREAARLLVVDDSVTTRQLLASLLEAAGYEVQTAVDGEAAWRWLLSDAPVDLVVSDIDMPRVDGFQLLARMRASPQAARVPVVLVTALSSDADRRRALELGADAYVVKGRFDQQALLETIQELLP